MATETKPPITCHVLDTTIGKPAANIPVTLTLHNPPSTSSSTSPTPTTFTATTNPDGRVTSWAPASSAPFTSPASLSSLFHSPGDQKYSLTFNTEEYFGAKGVKTFFPEVEVKFVVREGDGGKAQHYHVPVLLGPFGYTTYRGS
ncbi:Hydroxyisourate hydrolase [Ophiobolus disseminans]|uniref:5-hydroxyisourate hydrolase n=1 Tax=Ophiobolus disseminans TaxID=1469910 RepID=A0A6A7AH41_9PLEO|nr:Hydroxyisourate hydrolase [Ophiobolus disseminans]